MNRDGPGSLGPPGSLDRALSREYLKTLDRALAWHFAILSLVREILLAEFQSFFTLFLRNFATCKKEVAT